MFIGWASPEKVDLFRQSALDMRATAENMLSETEPDLISVSRDGVISDLISERGAAQFNIPNESGVMIVPEMTRIIVQVMAVDAELALTSTLGKGDRFIVSSYRELRESFLWFVGDMWIANERFARYEPDPARAEGFTETAAWFRVMGAGLNALANGEPDVL